MSGENKIYNIQDLVKNAELNAKDGVERNGTRRAYFDALSTFEVVAPQVLEKLEHIKNRKKMIAELGVFQKMLMNIGDTILNARVDKLIFFLEENDKNVDIRDKLYNLKKVCMHLCGEIQRSEVSMDELAEEEKPQEEEVPGKPVGQIRIKTFSKLTGLIEGYDYDAALEETNALAAYTYDERIDELLQNIAQYIENFEQDEAAAATRRLAQRVMLVEASSKRDGEKKKILSVDDVPDVLNTLKSMLKDEFNIYCVTNHTAALKFLASNTPDLILLDIEMPDMSGFDLLKLIRKNDACKNTPVLFLTGNASVDNIKAAIELKGNDFIRKPIEYDVLISKIHKHLE